MEWEEQAMRKGGLKNQGKCGILIIVILEERYRSAAGRGSRRATVLDSRMRDTPAFVFVHFGRRRECG